MTEKNKGGAPRVADKKDTKKFTRLNSEELARYESLRDYYGLNDAAYIRFKILEDSQPVQKKSSSSQLDLGVIGKFRGDLSGGFNNLNQITRMMQTEKNLGMGISPERLEEVMHEVELLKGLLSLVLKRS